MKETYTIGEVAKLLKLGNDAIRFYEKKGLVHPIIDANNQYRMYHMDHILELLDVIYYRHLDISLSEIQQLHIEPNKEKTKALMKRKKEETTRKIAYQQQLLKKINYMLDMCEHIDQQLHTCTLDTMPAFHILFEDKETASFYQEQIQHISEEEFVLCAVLKQFTIDEQTLKKQKSMIVMEHQVLQDLGIPLREKNMLLEETQCVTAILPLPKEDLSYLHIQPLLSFAKTSHYELESTLYAKEIPLTFYHDHDHYYTQIYIPIKKGS